MSFDSPQIDIDTKVHFKINNNKSHEFLLRNILLLLLLMFEYW